MGDILARLLLPILSSLNLYSSWLYKRCLAARVKHRKELKAASPFKYTDSPNLSLVLLSFNHRGNIVPITSRLRQTQAQEIIICEDGSIDGSEREWLRRLTRPNDFVIRSNDIHEIRSYNRAIDYARGDIVCVLQDDDLPDPSGKWVSDALALFERYPKLAILGSWIGIMWDLSAPDPSAATKLFGHQALPLAAHWNVRPIPFVEPDLNMRFMFVHSVGIGPIFFRRDVFRSLGGFDQSFSKPGQPGVHLDHDICFKAWLAGHHVGLHDAPDFEIGVGGQGTLMFGAQARSANDKRNFETIKERYADKTEAIERVIERLNGDLRSCDDIPVARELS